MRCRVPLYGTRGIVMPSPELQQQRASCLPASALGTKWINARRKKKKKSLSSCRASSWYWGGLKHPEKTPEMITFTARITDMRSQDATEETCRSKCWSREFLKASGYYTITHSYEIIPDPFQSRLQAQCRAGSPQRMQNISCLKKEGHTQSHIRLSLHRWGLTELHTGGCCRAHHPTLPGLTNVSLHTCPQVREVSDLRETLGSFLKHYTRYSFLQ